MLTLEQQAAVDTISSPDCSYLKVNAVSGAGKTSTLIAIAQALPVKHGLYLAFNKAIANEAYTKFPSHIECRTLHSLAYAFIIKGSTRTIQEFTVDNITDNLLPTQKYDIVQHLNEFFASASLDIEEFLSGNELLPYCYKYLHQMEDGTIPSTFGFILKRFQVLVHLNMIKLPHYDLLMLDEAGDVTACSLDLFNHIPATKKVMVGDVNQNLYSFMHTINGFEEMDGHGKELSLTQSFRVSTAIAKRVEKFCHKYIDPKMKFSGYDSGNDKIDTIAYLSRTNSALISRMMKLHDTRTPYTLLRPLDSIFSLPLTIANINNPKWNIPKEYIHIKAVADKYYESTELPITYKSVYGYIRHYFMYDVQIQTAISLVTTHSPKTIIDTYFTAKTLARPKQKITLATGFSSKGCEYDYVYIEDDLNSAVEDTIQSPDQDLTMLYLYYTACTRARKVLDNAKALSL